MWICLVLAVAIGFLLAARSEALNTFHTAAALVAAALGALVLLLPLAGSAATASSGPPSSVAIDQPAILIVRISEAREVSGAPADQGILASIFRVKVRVIDVIAGDDRLERQTLTVFLQAGNAGYLHKGNHVLIAIDPAAYAGGRPIYWNRALQLQCFDPAVARDLGLTVSRKDVLEFEGQTCVPE